MPRHLSAKFWHRCNRQSHCEVPEKSGVRKILWPDTDDNDCIDRACVTKVLPEPQMDRRSRIAFPIEID